jgi:phosphoribosylamine--glycine ligase
MKILVLGSGGREHAIVWKLKKDGHQVVCAPGNAGICRIAECVALNPEDIVAVNEYVRKTGFDLTIVGPEAPLVAGIADEFRRSGLPIFGPGQKGAQLEGSKAFSKALMQEAGIPTARFETFTDVDKARSYLAGQRYPLVVKASGLAMGKGAVIVHSRPEAEALVEEMMVSRSMGEACATVVIEEFLSGEEASIIGITDGERVAYLAPSQDHKALLDGDQGPNTGGMGAYAPAPIVTPELQAMVERQVFVPLLEGLRRRGIEYRGVIYAGIMVTDKGPYVLEFNCRFGDPETQVILPLLSADLGEMLLDAAKGDLQSAVRISQSAVAGYTLCVVAASAGYPGKYEKGKVISGVGGQGSGSREQGTGVREDVVVFHAGTRVQDGVVVTSGGRVLGVTGLGPTLPDAKKKAYDALSNVRFEGMQYRRDIGDKGIRRSQKSEIRSQNRRPGNGT